MKVSELMNPAGVRLYANIKEAADVLGILVELQEETGAITSDKRIVAALPTIQYLLENASGKTSAAPRPSGTASRCPTPATPGYRPPVFRP